MGCMKTKNLRSVRWIFSVAVLLLAGCASTAPVANSIPSNGAPDNRTSAMAGAQAQLQQLDNWAKRHEAPMYP